MFQKGRLPLSLQFVFFRISFRHCLPECFYLQPSKVLLVLLIGLGSNPRLNAPLFRRMY